MIHRTHKDKIKVYTPKKLKRLFDHHARWATCVTDAGHAKKVEFTKGRVHKVFYVRRVTNG